MASSYVNDLRLNEMATGDASGSWGTNTNTNLTLIGEALGYGTEGITTNANTHTSTIADGATDPVRALYVEYTGTLDSACTITIAPNTVNKVCFIENGTSGSQNIIIKQGSGATITIPNGDTKAVYLDGAGSGAKVVDAFARLNVVDLTVEDDLFVTDDMTVGGTLGVTGVLTATSLDISGDIDVDGTANLDIVDIDGAVNMATTALVTGVLTTTAATVFNGGFVSNDGSTITTADNTDTLTLQSTDADAVVGPVLSLKRDSSSPADNDALAYIKFVGENDADEEVQYVYMQANALDVTDGTEDGKLEIFSQVAGAGVSRIKIDSNEIAFNDSSVDLDFRVESDSSTHALFVDGAGGVRVMIGTSTEGQNQADNLTVSDAGNMGMTLRSTNSGECSIFFSDGTSGDDEFRGSIQYIHSDNSMRFATNATEKARINSDGDLCVGSSEGGNAGQRTISIGTAGSVDGGVQVWARTNGVSFVQFGDGTSSADNFRGYISYSHATDKLELGTTSATRMTIDGSGLAYIGTTAGGGQLNVHALGDRAVITARVNANGDTCFTPLNASGTGVGNILANASSTTYATSSDYRLKENVDYTWDATTRLKQLKPARFNFIIDDTNTLVDGFLAHEVSGIVPEAVNGTHNETKTLTKVVLSSSNTVLAEDIEQSDWTAGKSATTDRDGDAVAAIYPSDSTWAAEHVVPKMQGIDQSKLVPLLVKTILELEARITALES